MELTQPAPCRILLVEDDLAIGEMVTALLQTEGYDVHWATGGQAALAALHEPLRLPTLILLDLLLPDMPGEQVYAALDQHPHGRSIAVIVISALPGAAGRAATLPRAIYLPKPFDPDHLLGLVRYACP